MADNKKEGPETLEEATKKSPKKGDNDSLVKALIWLLIIIVAGAIVWYMVTQKPFTREAAEETPPPVTAPAGEEETGETPPPVTAPAGEEETGETPPPVTAPADEEETTGEQEENGGEETPPPVTAPE